jgi:hypothetical protein
MQRLQNCAKFTHSTVDIDRGTADGRITGALVEDDELGAWAPTAGATLHVDSIVKEETFTMVF